MQLSQSQNRILNAEDKKIIVMASAASGKTFLLTEKVKKILKTNISPEEIAVITFTNMAAETLRERLGDNYKKGLFIGTIHSLANHFLLEKNIYTNHLINNEDFDGLFHLVKENPQCIKTIKFLLLDEAQDISIEEFNFIFEMIKPESFFIVGDMKQAIYQFKGGDEKLLYKLSLLPDVVTYQLNENYRNSYAILNFAKNLIKSTGLKDESFSRYPKQGKVINLQYSENKIIELIKKETYSDWAILTRTNKETENLINLLQKNNIPCESFKQGDLNKKELSEKMTNNTVKVLTIHCAKGLEWKKVIVLGMKYYNNIECNINYVAATRAKEELYWISKAPSKRKKKKEKFELWE